MTALSSISHNGGQSYGIQSMLRREKFVLPDGSVEEVPVISGNGMRGLLRDRGMLHMCKHLGYGAVEEDGTVTGLTLGAFYFLFSGGALTEGASAIDVSKARKIRALIPLVGVFGGALGNMIMPGKLKMGKLIPVTAETAHLIPERFKPGCPASVWEFVQQEMYTRKDDEKNEHLRTVIAGPVRALLDGPTPNLAKENPEHKQQMMYYTETLAAGTQFYWKIVLDDVDDVEFEAFLTALVELSRMPYIGGKSGIGHGEISVKFDKWLRIDSRVEAGTEISVPIGGRYHAYLENRGGEIRDFLAGL